MRIWIVAAFAGLLVAGLVAAPAHPPMGSASNDGVDVAATFLDAAAMTQAVGADYSANYTVIEVTVTPKGGKTLELQPDDFLLRIGSDSERSGPVQAAQILGAGGGLILHRDQQRVIGVDLTVRGNTGVTAATGSSTVSKDQVSSLQGKLLPGKNISASVTGLLFFPIAKKKAKDLDLVYSSAGGKLHVAFK